MSLIIHVPHSSLRIPAGIRDQFILNDDELFSEAKESADLHTDMLAKMSWPEAEMVCADVSRLVVDVERYADDLYEPMSKVGRGMIYTKTHDSKNLRRSLSIAEKKYLEETYYAPHWSYLREVAKNKILVDLHSYPSESWPIEISPDSGRPQIDLGTDPSLTPEMWIKNLKTHFEGAGYTVGINTPYSGVIDAGSRYAIMIEIRRDIIGFSNYSPAWEKLTRTLSAMPVP